MSADFKEQLLDLFTTEELSNELLAREAEDDLSEDELWGVALAERPSDDVNGWDDTQPTHGRNWNPLLGLIKVAPLYTDPETGKKWRDYAPQFSSDKDWYFIATGAMDVSARVWNSFWRTKEKINQLFPRQKVGPDANMTEEEYAERNRVALQRLREYPGKATRSDPKSWPEPWRSAFFEGHPDWKGTGEK